MQYLKINKNLFSSMKSYTTEFENNQNQINFLHTTITTDRTNSYDFEIFRKLAITNIMKPNSNMTANTTVAVFKGFLSVVYKSSSKCFIDEENQFSIDLFTENGDERKILEKISKNYLNKLLNSPVSSKGNSEDTNKMVKLPWIPIIGRQLRKAFKKKNYICIKFGFKIVIMPKQGQDVT